jgi:hypothetical protein
VRELRCPRVVKDNILRGELAVDDSVGMSVPERPCYANEDVEPLLDRQRRAIQQALPQRSPLGGV